MSTFGFNYSDLVAAVQNNETERVNEFQKELLPRLTHYLMKSMNAVADEARICARKAFAHLLEYIKTNTPRKKLNIFSYLFDECRTEYFRHTTHRTLNTPRLDYSELVFALQSDEKILANKLTEALLPRLIDYLMINMNATRKDAEECVHRAFYNVLEYFIENETIRTEAFLTILLRACRHEYIRYQKHQHRFSSPIEDNPELFVHPADQFQKLLDEERQQILCECLGEISEAERFFIKYFIDKPDVTTEEASEYFGFSSAKIRAEKSRILGMLHHCYKRKRNGE